MDGIAHIFVRVINVLVIFLVVSFVRLASITIWYTIAVIFLSNPVLLSDITCCFFHRSVPIMHAPESMVK